MSDHATTADGRYAAQMARAAAFTATVDVWAEMALDPALYVDGVEVVAPGLDRPTDEKRNAR